MMIKKIIAASRELDIDRGLEKSVQFGKDLVLIQVLSDPDFPLLRAWMPKDCRDFAIVKRVMKKIAKRCAAMAVLIGRDKEEALWSRISYASYSTLLGVHNGTIILEILPVHHLEGLRLNFRHAEESEPEETESPVFRAASDSNSNLNHKHKAILLNSMSVIRRELPEPNLGWPLLLRKSSSNQAFKKPEARDMSVVEWAMSLSNRVTTAVNQIALHSNQTSVDSETNTNDSTINDRKTEEAIRNSEAESVINGNRSSENESSELDYNGGVSVSLNTKDLELYSKPGWPLLRIAASITSDSFSEYEVIVSTKVESHVQIENCLPALRKMPSDLNFHCKQFSLRELKLATSGFCPEILIGEGGCSNVYKGCLLGGKPVAVKVLKSYKEAWSDFSLEVDMVSSLKHKHITPLIGVCVEDENLILVYDFFPRGSLEEILHGESKKSVLPWGIRFKVAMAIAEALNYLHNECSPPVIHRDVKSSNILLSDEFQPQLSDFGLAIRGPIDSTYMIDSNVVGTFGYIAPEYFMEGRVSDKIDVYSFGVVLLELVSGRRPISSKALEGQESFIQLARALLERRNLQGLVDPALDGNFDIAQMYRVVLATSLCLNQLDGYRPKVSQILEILRGEEEPSEWYKLHATDLQVQNSQEDDEHSPEFVHKLYTYLSVSFKEDDSTSKCRNYTTSRCCRNYTPSRCRTGKGHRLKLKSYLKKKQG